MRSFEKYKMYFEHRGHAIIYFAWRSFFRNGLYDTSYPIDWRGACRWREKRSN